MSELRSILISAVFWTYVVVSTIALWMVATLLFLITVPFDRRRRLLHLFTCFWAHHYVRIMPLWQTRFEGRDRIRPGQTYVIVANHQSLLDILVLFGLYKHFKWVSKRSVFQIPFIGWNMYLNDYVGLHRGRAGSITRMMRECRRHLERGSSVLIFPEGTRSPDGRMRRFRQGAFALAQEVGVPVIPVAVKGTRDALPKHGMVFRQKGTLNIDVHILDPVSPDAAPEPDGLTEIVEDRVRAELGKGTDSTTSLTDDGR